MNMPTIRGTALWFEFAAVLSLLLWMMALSSTHDIEPTRFLCRPAVLTLDEVEAVTDSIRAKALACSFPREVLGDLCYVPKRGKLIVGASR